MTAVTVLLKTLLVLFSFFALVKFVI